MNGLEVTSDVIERGKSCIEQLAGQCNLWQMMFVVVTWKIIMFVVKMKITVNQFIDVV